MSSVVPLRAEGEATIYVEVEQDFGVVTTVEPDGQVAGGGAEGALERLTEVGDRIGQVCNEVYEHTTAALNVARPTELSLEFGLKLGGEAGIPFVTKGTAEATFTVKATWTHEAALGSA